MLYLCAAKRMFCMLRLRRTTFLRKVNNNEKDYDGCKWVHQSALFVNLN